MEGTNLLILSFVVQTRDNREFTAITGIPVGV